jgi:hypothetical protein
MTVVIALMSIVTMPGLVILLVVVAGIDRIGQSANRRVRLPWRKEESGRPLAGASLSERPPMSRPREPCAVRT